MREFNTKVSQGKYSITFETDDRKAFEQVQTLCRILIDGKDGEVIPVEWLLERAKLCTADYADCLHYAVEAWQTEQKHMVNGQWKFPKE